MRRERISSHVSRDDILPGFPNRVNPHPKREGATAGLLPASAFHLNELLSHDTIAKNL